MTRTPTAFALLSRFGMALGLAAGLTLPLAGCGDDRPEPATGTAASKSDQAATGTAANDNGARAADAQAAGIVDSPNTAEGVKTAETSEEAIKITKTFPERIRMGTPMTYRLSVDPQQDLTGLLVREELPEGFAFESSSPEAQLSEDGRTLTFRMANLSAGAPQQIEIKGSPRKVGALQACTTYEIDRGVCAAFEVVNPQLRLTKQAPETAGVCQPVAYTYVIRNEGDSPAENVVIFDTLPEGLAVDGARQVKLEVGTLAAGQEVSREVQVLAEKPLQDAGSYAYAESNLDEVRSERVATRFLAPQLTVQAQARRPYEYIGKTASFNVTVRNTGEIPSHHTLVRVGLDGAGELAGINGQAPGEARLATGTEAQKNNGATDIAGDGVNIGTLAPGESRGFTVEVATEEAGQVSLAATAVAVCGRTKAALAEARDAASMQIRTLSSLQVFVVDKVDPVRVGEETVYELSITNEGSGPEQNIQVSGELPEGGSFVNADGPTGVTADGRNLAFAALPQLAPGETATWYIRMRADQATGSAKFVANVKSDTVKPVTTSEPTRLY